MNNLFLTNQLSKQNEMQVIGENVQNVQCTPAQYCSIKNRLAHWLDKKKSKIPYLSQKAHRYTLIKLLHFVKKTSLINVNKAKITTIQLPEDNAKSTQYTLKPLCMHL